MENVFLSNKLFVIQSVKWLLENKIDKLRLSGWYWFTKGFYAKMLLRSECPFCPKLNCASSFYFKYLKNVDPIVYSKVVNRTNAHNVINGLPTNNYNRGNVSFLVISLQCY